MGNLSVGKHVKTIRLGFHSYRSDRIVSMQVYDSKLGCVNLVQVDVRWFTIV